MAGANTASGREADVFGDFARGSAFGRVAASTRMTYEAIWKMWLSWRTCAEMEIWLDAEMGDARMIEELAQYVAFSCAMKRIDERTVARKLVAVNLYLEQWVGLSLRMRKGKGGEAGDK